MTKAQGKLRKREQLIAALLSSSTVQQAARLCGISSRTAQRWLTQADFQKAYREAKSRLLEAATTRLRAEAGEAVNTLAEISGDLEAPPAARVTAASRILELAMHSHEVEQLEEQIKKLEVEANEF